MSVIHLFFAVCILFCTASAKEISDISFSSLVYTPLTSLRYPEQGWTASFDYSIPNTSGISAGDYFEMSMPYVYRVKFADTNPSMNITLEDGVLVFQCYATQQAAYIYDATIVKCEAMTDLSSYSQVSGSMSFSLNFNNGNSIYEYELKNANYFDSQKMTIPLFNDLSATVEFDAVDINDKIYPFGRSTTYNSLETYYLGMRCPSGRLLGGTATINYDTDNKGFTLDCSSPQVYISKKYNNWWFPQEYANSNADVVCYDSTLLITMGEADPDYSLWVNALQSVDNGINTINHDVYMSYSCVDSGTNSTYTTAFSTTVKYEIYQGINMERVEVSTTAPSSSLDITSVSSSISTAVSTTTTAWNGSYTTTYATSSNTVTQSDGLVVYSIVYYVETPAVAKSTTTYTGWTGSYNATYSTAISQSIGTDGITTSGTMYYVETPTSVAKITTTSYTSWTGTFTSTYATVATTNVGTDGITTDMVTYYVETPVVTTLETRWTSWTGEYSSTYSTDTVTFVGSDSISTTDIIIYYVKTPKLSSSTHNSTYAEPATTDITTGHQTSSAGIETTNVRSLATTVTGTPAIATSSIVHSSTTEYTSWTGYYVTTYSTFTTTFIGSDQNTTIDTTYYVETPDANSLPANQNNMNIVSTTTTVVNLHTSTTSVVSSTTSASNNAQTTVDVSLVSNSVSNNPQTAADTSLVPTSNTNKNSVAIETINPSPSTSMSTLSITSSSLTSSMASHSLVTFTQSSFKPSISATFPISVSVYQGNAYMVPVPSVFRLLASIASFVMP